MRFLLVLAIALFGVLAFGVACGGDEEEARVTPSPVSESDSEAEEWEAEGVEEGEVDEGDGEGADADIDGDGVSDDDDGRPRVSVTLDVSPRDYVGPSCPITLTFSGTITLEVGSGTVSYQFLDIGEVVISEGTLTFDSPGTRDVSTTLNRGHPAFGSLISDWAVIRILEPQELESNRANYTVDCREAGWEEDCPDSDMDTVCDADDDDDDNDSFRDSVEEDSGSDPFDDASVPENDTANPDSCIDDVDNDGDGLTDGVDPGCP